MSIKVFHFMPNSRSNEERMPFGCTAEQARKMWDGENPNWSYVQVAEVTTDDKERAFERTNHIDSNWTCNTDVTPFDSQGRYRSTSTGDVMQDATGQLWLCGNLGWTQFTSKKCPIFVCKVSPSCSQHPQCHAAQRCLKG